MYFHSFDIKPPQTTKYTRQVINKKLYFSPYKNSTKQKMQLYIELHKNNN